MLWFGWAMEYPEDDDDLEAVEDVRRRLPSRFLTAFGERELKDGMRIFRVSWSLGEL